MVRRAQSLCSPPKQVQPALTQSSQILPSLPSRKVCSGEYLLGACAETEIIFAAAQCRVSLTRFQSMPMVQPVAGILSCLLPDERKTMNSKLSNTAPLFQTASPSVVSQGWTALMWVLTIGVALASWRFMIGGVEQTMPGFVYHAQLRPIAFYTHIIMAPIALALVPFQLWRKLRTGRPAVHRVLGRIYGAAILLASVTGFWIAYTTEAGPVAAWGFGVLAVVWFVTTALGVRFAMQRDFQRHREWIIRSVAMTCAAVTLRLYLLSFDILDLSSATTYQATAWLCWVPNLIVAELIIRRSKVLPTAGMNSRVRMQVRS